MSEPQYFGFAFEQRYRRTARAFGVTEHRAWARVVDNALTVRFGPWLVHTSLDNVSEVTHTGPYSFLRTAGPARLGLSDRSLTFATTAVEGVQVDFVEPITGIDPAGWIKHSSLTVTPADPAGFANALQH